jgi:hypothetical protein
MRLVLTIVFISINLKLLACNGCSVSTGIVNNEPVNYFSLKMRSTEYDGVESSFFRHTGHGGAFTETYFNYDFSAKYFFYKNWYAQGLFSYQQTRLSTDSVSNLINGITDPILLIGYNNLKLFENWQLNYNFFGGLDFGVGNYKTILGEEYSPGSNSFDGLAGFDVLVKVKKVGFSLKGNIKLNFENDLNYSFGNGVNSSFLFLFYHEKENLTYIPFIGVTYELNEPDYLNKDIVFYTSSEVLFFDAGVNFLFKDKLLIGGKYMLGFYEDIPGWESVSASGFEIELSYVFGK